MVPRLLHHNEEELDLAYIGTKLGKQLHICGDGLVHDSDLYDMEAKKLCQHFDPRCDNTSDDFTIILAYYSSKSNDFLFLETLSISVVALRE